MDCEAQWAQESQYIFKLWDVLLMGASQCSPFLCWWDHNYALWHYNLCRRNASEFVQLNFYEHAACFMKREEEEDVREGERNRKEEVEWIFAALTTPML